MREGFIVPVPLSEEFFALVRDDALAAKTEPAKLGEVTCFLSHSWRDEDEVSGAKYKEFSRWAKTHEETTGKEPTLWLVRLPQHPTCKHAPALRAAWPLAAG